jgi:outer membrane protein assembly factor BamB
VYGYNIKKKCIDWDFFIGSDMDGSPVVTSDSCILVAVEKQYINGPGGIFKLDPSKKPEKAVEWFFPTGDFTFSDWEGGVIGSASVSHRTQLAGYPEIAAFSAIDGNLYVVHQDKTVAGKKAIGPDGKQSFDVPQLLFRYKTGPSISTPIIIGNRILAAGYGGIYLFEFDKYMHFSLLSHQPFGCESTPFAYRGRVYIASRNGNLYCLGSK